MACSLADITISNVSDIFFYPGPEFPFCLSYILHAATSFETGHKIDYPGSAAVNRSVDIYNNSSNRGLDGLGVGDIGASRAGLVAGFAVFDYPHWSQRWGEV